MSSMVRCADCGFLAIRNCQTRQLVEVELGVRKGASFPTEELPPSEQTGRYNFLGPETKPIYVHQPICFMVETEAMRESQEVAEASERDKDDADKHFQAFIAKPRVCESFTPWIQGLTPREHREMLDQRQLLTFQKEREDSDREWRRSQAEQDHIWRRDEARWRRIELVVMGIIVTLVTVVTNIVCAFIQRGDWPNPK